MIINGTGPYNGPGGFDRGMQSTMHCGNNPESWVRGSASLDTGSGAISMVIQLETDSTTAGPKGKVKVTVRDANGNALATATSDEIGMGGKPPGGAVIKNFSSNASIPLPQAQKAQSLYVEAQCTGSSGGLWGIDLNDVLNAFKIVVAVVSAVGG